MARMMDMNSLAMGEATQDRGCVHTPRPCHLCLCLLKPARVSSPFCVGVSPAATARGQGPDQGSTSVAVAGPEETCPRPCACDRTTRPATHRIGTCPQPSCSTPSAVSRHFTWCHTGAFTPVSRDSPPTLIKTSLSSFQKMLLSLVHIIALNAHPPWAEEADNPAPALRDLGVRQALLPSQPCPQLHPHSTGRVQSSFLPIECSTLLKIPATKLERW